MYNWDSLSEESKAYVDRYIRTTSKTREEALKENIVQAAVTEYEKKRRK